MPDEAAPVISRFAPSPTGHLHLGHAYSALLAEAAARDGGGRFLLRIEDIDGGRCRPEYDAAILDDLAWLGLVWEEPVRRQSAHMGDYDRALSDLDDSGLLYPCFCTRAEIRAEIEAAGQAPHGPDGPLYPGTCRRLDASARRDREEAGEPFALRLDMAKAAARAGALAWHDRGRRNMAAEPARFGDVVLARKDVPTSYHLAVTVDDNLQEVNLVVRGDDLFEATHVHRLLQALLGLETPAYHHHPLITGDDGRRLAKRDQAMTLRALREAGKSPVEVRTMVGLG